jgi:MFS family permease
MHRLGARALTAGGLVLTAAGLLAIAWHHDTAGLLVGLALAGVGLGAFTPANNAGIMVAAPVGHTGVVSGVLNMTRGIGTALGVAVASALFTLGAGGPGATHPDSAHGLTLALGVLGLITLATGAALVLERRRTLDVARQREHQACA